MIFGSKEVKCIFDVLRILYKGSSRYSIMYTITKVSHTTLQIVLKKLVDSKFIKRHDMGHMNVEYTLTKKGMRLLESLIHLNRILKE